MYPLKHVLNILLLFASCPLFAQSSAPGMFKKCAVNTINYEQGLLNNDTNEIITDSLGFTWISTAIGMQRYNGYVLENINPVIDRDTIRIKTPVYFFNLQGGRLWISCKRGILEYDPKTNAFQNIIPVNSSSEAFYAIIPLAETPEGIWCMQQNKGLVIYGKNGRLLKAVDAVDPQIIDMVLTSGDWLTTANKNLLFIRDPARQGFFEINTTQHSLIAARTTGTDILGLSCDATSIYISSIKGINRFLVDGWKLLDNCSFGSVTNMHVRLDHLLKINGGGLLVSINDRLLEYDADLKNFRTFTTLNGAPILSAGDIEHIYRDKFDRIWLNTNDDIKRIQDKEIPFAYFKYPLAVNNFVRSLYFDEKKQLLLAGCFNGGLQLYDSSANPLWKEPLLTDDVKDILSIEKLNDDSYLIITWGKGWYLLNLPTRKLTKIDIPATSETRTRLFGNGFTSNLQRLNDSTILVTSFSNVYRCVFHGNNLRSCRPLLPFKGTPEDNVTTFVYSRSGILWAGCFKGSILRMDKNGLIKEMHLPDNFTIRCMVEDASGNIWAGSNSGLYIYDVRGNLLSSIFKRSGLLNDCIYSMVPLGKGAEVFASSNMGLSDITLNGDIKNYTKELGLQDNEFNTDAALKTKDGKFYFGGISGISAFYPAALKEFKDRPLLNVTRLVINDSSYNSSAGIWKGDTIDLQYNQNHLQVDFAAMGLLNVDKYLYRYRLLGFEKSWQSTYQPTGIRYILGAGNYTLQASCINGLSGQNFSKSLVIIVHSPWWLTWWFLSFIGIMAVSGVILLVSSYNKRKYQKRLQGLMIKQSIQNERERISRDLHDNLGAQANAIFYGTELLKKQNGHEKKLVDNLHDTAGDMLAILRETLWAMKITHVEAADLWLRVLNFARKIGAYYADIKIDINGTPPVKLALNASAALNMILIVQEAINNAIRHSGASVITISSYTSENLWRIEIMDDGDGFDLIEVSKKAESYGLENMAERASESNIVFDVNSLPRHGTKVFLEIDIHKMETQIN
jgi:signal transduction histidine kinase